MFRWLLTCLILCAGTVVVMYVLFNDKTMGGGDDADAGSGSSQADKTKTEQAKPLIVKNTVAEATARQPLVVNEARILVAMEQQVPSERDGVLLFVGTPLRPGEKLPQGDELKKKIREGKLIEASLGYLVIKEPHPERMAQDQLVRFPDLPNELYRYRREGESVEPGKLRVAMMPQWFRKLEVGDRVNEGDLLAVVNPQIALEDLEIKNSKFEAAESERRASAKTRDEAKKRFDAMVNARQITKKAVSDDEFRGGELTWERYIEEEIAKQAAVRVAERELNSAQTILRMHEIRAKIPGVVKVVYKNRGDAVKNLEPVLQVQNTDLLRVEGVVEVQDAQLLQNEMVVSVEPTQQESPRLVLRGHSLPITGVAVSKGPKPMIVSGSDDQSVRVWDAVDGRELWGVVLHSAVRAVACTPPAAPYNLVLAGTFDGSAHLINLDNLDKPEDRYQLLPETHQSAVNCVAFSPDGSLCATGGEDRSIFIWKIAPDKDNKDKLEITRLHRLPAAHKAPVTHLQFVAPDSDEPLRLISVGGDKVLTVWNLGNDNSAPTKLHDYEQRGGNVDVLGSDGKRVLFDQEKELRLHSLQTKTLIEGRLRNPSGAGNFTTLALFAPDGKTILTNSASENRVQLWRTPPAQGRGSELRQFIWNTAPVTCGAFFPDSTFVVTGTQDQQVLVWKMPSQDEIKKRLTARIKSIEKSTESSSRQVVRISAELDDRPPWLVAGGPATIVIAPDELYKPRP